MQQMHHLLLADRSVIIMVRKIALSEGNVHRALLSMQKVTALSTSRRNFTRTKHPVPRKAPALLLDAPAGSESHWTSPLSTQRYRSVPVATNVPPTPVLPTEDPLTFVTSAIKQEGMLLMDIDTVSTGLSDVHKDGRPVSAQTLTVPELTPQHINRALSSVPARYWSLKCWSCRDSNHKTFTYLHLTVSQRILSTPRYYLHKIRQNPVMEECYNQKRVAHSYQGPDSAPGTLRSGAGQECEYVTRRHDK